MAELNLEHLRPLQAELDGHPIYAALQTRTDLRVFMAHHVFSVWDFMSLVKYLQARIAPTTVPWMPQGDPTLRYFINQLVLEEESDQVEGPGGPGYASHFESYLTAMEEVGADTNPMRGFLELVRTQGLDAALYSDPVPLPARYFCETTFCFIREDKPHAVAAAFALGREGIIPEMFRRILDRIALGPDQAPSFHCLPASSCPPGRGFSRPPVARPAQCPVRRRPGPHRRGTRPPRRRPCAPASVSGTESWRPSRPPAAAARHDPGRRRQLRTRPPALGRALPGGASPPSPMRSPATPSAPWSPTAWTAPGGRSSCSATSPSMPRTWRRTRAAPSPWREPVPGDVQQGQRLTCIGECTPPGPLRGRCPGTLPALFPRGAALRGAAQLPALSPGPRRFHYNGGFAAARWLGCERILRTKPPESGGRGRPGRRPGPQPGTAAHGPAPEPERCDLWPVSPLRIAGIDPWGLDLGRGDRLRRVPFPEAMADARGPCAGLSRPASGRLTPGAGRRPPGH